jgi:hypothetical protein
MLNPDGSVGAQQSGKARSSDPGRLAMRRGVA